MSFVTAKNYIAILSISTFLLSSTLFLVYRAVQFDRNYPNPLPLALTEKTLTIEEDINLTTKCDLQPGEGSCGARIEKFYYNKSTNMCDSYIHGGCGAEVPFDTLEQCQKTCVAP